MSKILLADDSTHVQRMGTKILAAEGHEVATVSNGQAAIKMLKDFVPDLLVADVFMPGKNGYELCEYLKSDPALGHVPVLLLVGAMEPFDPVEGRRVRADGVVTKPLESSDLVANVQKLLAAMKKPAPPAKAKEKPAAELQQEAPIAPSKTEEALELQPVVEIPPEAVHEPVGMFEDLLEAPAPAVQEEAADERVSTDQLSDWLRPQPDAAAVAKETIDLPTLGPEEAAADSETFRLDAHPGAVGEESFAQQAAGQQEMGEQESSDQGAVLEPPTLEPADTVAGDALASSLPEVGLEHPAGFEPATPGGPVSPLPEAHTQPSLEQARPHWSATPAEVTEEDKKLFASPKSDWEGLMKLVEEQGQESPRPVAETTPATVLASEPVASGESAVISLEPAEPETAPAALAAAPEPAGESAAEAASNADAEPLEGREEGSPPNVAPIDRATIEQIVREAVEEMMPQIVERITRTTGVLSKGT